MANLFDSVVGIPFSELVTLYNERDVMQNSIETLRSDNERLSDNLRRNDDDNHWRRIELDRTHEEMQRLTDEIARLRQENRRLMMGAGNFAVRLDDFDGHKIEAIKLVREVTEVGLKEAKDTVEAAPVTFIENISLGAAENIAGTLREKGCKATIVETFPDGIKVDHPPMTDGADASDELVNTPQ